MLGWLQQARIGKKMTLVLDYSEKPLPFNIKCSTHLHWRLCCARIQRWMRESFLEEVVPELYLQGWMRQGKSRRAFQVQVEMKSAWPVWDSARWSKEYALGKGVGGKLSREAQMFQSLDLMSTDDGEGKWPQMPFHPRKRGNGSSFDRFCCHRKLGSHLAHSDQPLDGCKQSPILTRPGLLLG